MKQPKTSLLLLAALAAALSTHAQSRRGLWVTPNTALGAGTLSDIYWDSYESNLSAYFSIGADVGYMFNNYIGLFTGLNLAGYGYVIEDYNYQNPDLQYTGTQSRIEVPLYARFVAARPGRFGFFAHAGFKYGFLTGHKNYIEINGDRTALPQKDDMNNFSVSPFAYLGVHIPAGRRLEMMLGPEFSYQYTDLFSSASNMTGHYFNIGLKFGVGIKCGR